MTRCSKCDARIELAEIGNVVRVAVGAAMHVISKLKPVDPPLPESTTTRRTVVMVEAHSADEHTRAKREIIDKHTLAALTEFESADDSSDSCLRCNGRRAG